MQRHGGPEGLSSLPTREVELLLARLHGGTLRLPLTHPNLLISGLPHLVDKVTFLSTLEAPALRAVLVAVIAERRAQSSRAEREERAGTARSNSERPPGSTER
jgi:hypothetical protein